MSDGWRLPRKEQRVWVSLAGIVTQVVIAGAAAVTALLVAAAGSSSALRDGLLVFALSTTVTALLNFMPFVKLDGYIALMSHLDIPHLRDLSMTDARRFVARMLFGGRYRRELPQVSWAVGFGLACMLFPLYLVAVAAGLWLPMVQGTGVTGAAVVLAGAAYVLYLMSTGTGRLVKEARAGGARLRRISGVGLLAALAVGAVLTFVRVPYTVDGGYVRDLDGTRLVLSEVADLDAIEDGAEVTLRRGGLVTRTDTGSAVIGDGRARRTTAPLSAFVPVAEGRTSRCPRWASR
ncbi:hypothetical protein SHKM778_77850 [Streptomyces sp. KM77-8]|uniref:Uncharacterized protein n=1 Tax=Streptomyces haneummycinicus TaxID=3074435 RepID=A0AAT9HV58_9ACTN